MHLYKKKKFYEQNYLLNSSPILFKIVKAISVESSGTLRHHNGCSANCISHVVIVNIPFQRSWKQFLLHRTGGLQCNFSEQTRLNVIIFKKVWREFPHSVTQLKKKKSKKNQLILIILIKLKVKVKYINFIIIFYIYISHFF